MNATCCTRSVQRALLATTLSAAAMMRDASWMHVGSMAITWAVAQHQEVVGLRLLGLRLLGLRLLGRRLLGQTPRST
jgi:hypothetical protein